MIQQDYSGIDHARQLLTVETQSIHTSEIALGCFHMSTAVNKVGVYSVTCIAVSRLSFSLSNMMWYGAGSVRPVLIARVGQTSMAALGIGLPGADTVACSEHMA